MADVEEESEERVICEDEEDTNIDIDSDDDEEYELGDDEDEDEFDHYDSPLDKIDEVLHFSNQLNSLQAAGGQELYNYLMQQLDQQQLQELENSVGQAQQYQQQLEMAAQQ